MTSAAHAERCRKIAAAVETLSQTESEELFRILHKHRFDYTRNNHGVFINLSWVPDVVLSQMEEYIQFCHQSKHELRKYESICDALNTKLASHEENPVRQKKDLKSLPKAAPTNRDTDTPQYASTSSEACEKANRVSASMRFYLLKKKYAKMGTIPNSTEIDLSRDEYVITT